MIRRNVITYAILYQTIIIEMRKKQFDLQKMMFTQQSDDQTKQISNQLIEMYNKEYSLVLGETKNFFADCKDFLNRFITLNNMGIGFNLPILLNKMLVMQSQIVSPTNKYKKQIKNTQKKKEQFQRNFMDIMNKMGEVIEQLLSFEIKIKTQYLGQAFNSPTKIKTRTNYSSIKQKRNGANGLKTVPQKPNQNPEQQQMLRAVLKKNMLPTHISQQKVCKMKAPPGENIDNLTKKIDLLKTKIQVSKLKEQKIWKIFNEKRPSRSMLAEESTPEQIAEEKQYKQLSDMLSDIVSQKNRNCYMSPYETVESSVR